jgi:hypothetical protein
VQPIDQAISRGTSAVTDAAGFDFDVTNCRIGGLL